MTVSGDRQGTLRSNNLLRILDCGGCQTSNRLVLVSATHLGLRVAPGGGAGVENVDLVVPTPEPEQGVSNGGLAEKIQISPTSL